MTPNLRYNKKFTRRLIKAMPKDDERVSLLTIDWHNENGTDVFGLCCEGWFKSTLFFLQKLDEDKYRLVVSDGSPLCSFYLIDDIATFVDFIGVKRLELDDKENVRDALEHTKCVPNTGLLIIDTENNEIHIYDHKNY